jgi:glycosyltransferase involved in cell wall biosynthesis
MSQDMGAFRISVIIPTFNRAFSLTRSIESVLDQSYTNFELIIVDDGSTDDSFDVIRAYLKDPRVRYIRHSTNKGAQAARNVGIKTATGEYIAFLDSDDEWVPEKLQIQVKKINGATPLRVIHGDAFVCKEETGEKKRCNRPKLRGWVYKELLEKEGPLFQCILAPKSCFEHIGYLDECVPSWQEWDTAIALSRFYEFDYCDEPLVTYYLHGRGTISKDKKRAADGWSYIVNKYQDEILAQLGRKTLSTRYLTSCAFYIEAGDKINAIKFLVKSFFTVPCRLDNLGMLIRVLFGERIETIARESYGQIRSKTKREAS